ncbi:type II 3-dehydroquinate dehydratase [Limibacillus halophilus]|uniref:3-dehydroquinate dehydratase n=1 Tax=Limibacillus halophilus TaxID=1579333 RepID=A0A839STI5_9PROT|nr:type II 3-dehydroquinate dehydratase [Limibacillus halophilus]MBB3065064.1 3-dehydroquinate dehydratase-2 [Limibacillus halophilus]
MTQSRSVLLLNGPNLNLLGTRQPEVYGSTTLAEIEARCIEQAKGLGLTLEARQSNHEGELVDWIQAARQQFAAIIINPGAFTHTSVALLDALQAFEGLVIEVHLSNIHRRESFRHHSYVSLAATGAIVGLGAQGYDLALQAIAARLTEV